MLSSLLISIRVYAKMALLILLRRPYKLTLLLSGGCNLRCQVCSIWRQPVTALTLTEVKTLWSAFRIKPCWINISGGEPTLADDLGPILAFFSGMKRPLLITLTTNGSSDCSRLLAPILARSRQSIIYVSISIDGAQPEHDAVRGRSGAFERAWRTYQSLRSLQKRWATLKVGISTTISRVNYRRILPFVLQRLRETPAMTFNLAQASPYYDNAPGDSFEKLPRDELIGLLRSIVHALPKLSLDSFLKIIYLQHAIRFLQGRPTPLPCASYRSNVLVTSQLDLVSCTLRFQPWAAPDAPREEKLRSAIAAIRRPAPRLKAVAADIRRQHCERGCHSPCENYVHEIAALLRPWSAARMLWTFVRACVDSALRRQSATDEAHRDEGSAPPLRV